MASYPARRLKSLDDIRQAMRNAPTAIPALVLDNIPRTGLTIEEVAAISGHAIDRIKRAVRNGEIKADGSGRGYIIPVAELDTIAGWATYQNTA